MSRILVAGIGNIFLGDDGFGCEVAQRLCRCALPAGVDVVDFGIRSMDLRYALVDGYDAVVLVDAVMRGDKPGTVQIMEPDLEVLEQAALAGGAQLPSMHVLDPTEVLRQVAALDAICPRVLLVSCEAESLGGDSGYLGLSDKVMAAVEVAATEIRALVEDLTTSGPLDLLDDHVASA